MCFMLIYHFDLSFIKNFIHLNLQLQITINLQSQTLQSQVVVTYDIPTTIFILYIVNNYTMALDSWWGRTCYLTKKTGEYYKLPR